MKTTEVTLSFNFVFITFLFLITGTILYFKNLERVKIAQIQSQANQSFATNIVKETEDNTYFRKVLFTGTRSQLVVMDIPPGGEVGEEVHKYTEQTLFFLSGTGKAIVNDQERPVVAGDVIVITPGTKHNFLNTGKTSLKLYTVYSPPNHYDGRIHVTKADADKDLTDEAFGDILR